MIKNIKLNFILSILIATTSCNNSYHKAIKAVRELPPPDYSYVIEPEYSQPKENIEFEIKELYAAEKVIVDMFRMHGYDKETKEQIEERFWPRIAILNSKSFSGYHVEERANKSAKEIANLVLNKISNSSDYDKIEIVFLRTWNDGEAKQEKRRIYLQIPHLEVTDFATGR